MKDKYRIRWGWVWRGNSRKLMCLAERSVSILGFHLWYSPLEESGWKYTEEEAKIDIGKDIRVREPLPKPLFLSGEAK